MSSAEPRDLVAALREREELRPDALAVVSADEDLSYAALAERARSIARLLAARGVAEGDRVAFVGRESADYYALLFAVARLGAVLVPINWKLTPHEVGHILEDAAAKVVFVDRDQGLAASLGDRAQLTDDPALRAASDGSAPLPEVAVGPDTPVAQLYTSGTTGLPKGVVLAHRSFFAVLRSLREAGLDWIRVDPDDRCLVGIPGFHVGGLWFACQAFNAGACVVSLPEFDADAARRTIVERRVSSGIFVPAMLRALLEATPVGADDFATLQSTIYGGAPISDTLLERCIRDIGGQMSQIYGLTETGNTAICLPPADHVPGSPRLRAAGRPYPCVEVQIVADDGVPLGPGEIGEVWLRTPAAMVEYWHRPDATAATLSDGWVRTGDGGRLDADGYLYLHDRLNDMIIVGGENVYPAEVENAIARHPAVADVAVVGVPDELTGESVVAYVQCEPGQVVSTRDLMLSVKPQLASFKLPRRYVMTDRIPRNPSGKILRRELRESHWVGHERRVH